MQGNGQFTTLVDIEASEVRTILKLGFGIESSPAFLSLKLLGLSSLTMVFISPFQKGLNH